MRIKINNEVLIKLSPKATRRVPTKQAQQVEK